MMQTLYTSFHRPLQVYVPQNTSQICMFHIFCQMHINGLLLLISIDFHCIFSSCGFLELDMVDLIIFF